MITVRALTFIGAIAGAAILQTPAPASSIAPCGRSTDAECYRPAPGGVLFSPSTDGAPIGADVARLILVERCAIGGVSTSPDCLALAQTPTPAPADRVEGPISPTITYQRPVLKWDVAAASLAEAQALKWYLHVDGERRDAPTASCVTAGGATPPGFFSCSIELPDLGPGPHTLAVQPWYSTPPVAGANAPRIILR